MSCQFCDVAQARYPFDTSAIHSFQRHSVRKAYGTVALGPEDSTQNDVAVMDDFIYGEPQPIR